MMKLHRNGRKGFTLVELAIVLAIAGVLFTGLWRLLSGGNQQLKDSASASQQAQLISSVKSFLSSPTGQSYMGGKCTAPPCAIGTNFTLPLPAAATPAGSGGCAAAGIPTATTSTQWCSTLPSGFSAATTNSYGQTYSIQVAFNSPVTSAGTPPATYSFMIVTVGGETASDTSGGRISSQIGGDGGFLYSAPPCVVGGTVLPACGAYGAWSSDPVASYGFTAATLAAGHVATRTYVSPEQNSNLPWLARIIIPGDVGPPYGYNTMTAGADLFLNAGGTYWLPGGTTPGTANNSLWGSWPLGTYGGRIVNINQFYAGMNVGDTNPAVTINDGNACTAYSFNSTSGTLNSAPDGSGTQCYASLQVNGNQVTTGMVEANVLWASQFLYGTTSDIRMKKNIAPLANALDNIMRLKPVTFRFKQTNKEDIGFIAQDLQKVYPQIVEGRPDGVLGVNYMGLLAPLVSSVQELKKENDQLREQLHAQQNEIRALQKNAKDVEQ